jgi:hypothetical protein
MFIIGASPGRLDPAERGSVTAFVGDVRRLEHRYARTASLAGDVPCVRSCSFLRIVHDDCRAYVRRTAKPSADIRRAQLAVNSAMTESSVPAFGWISAAGPASVGLP